MERPWGGRRLEEDLHILLPDSLKIGELWALVDRPEAQSIVSHGPFAGKTLHELWSEERLCIFGRKHLHHPSLAFPLLCKILDAREMLSLQVHPQNDMATERSHDEPKTEFWYFLKADPEAFCYAGIKKGVTREALENAVKNSSLENLLHRIAVKQDDALFIPSGRLHALGQGTLVVEIQQNSDTTYRVFDWNRRDSEGHLRTLHLEKALDSIDFEDQEPSLHDTNLMITSDYFNSKKWELTEAMTLETSDEFAIITCLSGQVECCKEIFSPGNFFLLPAGRGQTPFIPKADGTTLLCTYLASSLFV